MELCYTREIYFKNLKRTILQKQLFKVTNTEKPFSNVFISLQLTKNDAKFLPFKITSKKSK